MTTRKGHGGSESSGAKECLGKITPQTGAVGIFSVPSFNGVAG